MAVTATLEVVAIKVPPAVRDRGDSIRMLKQILRGLRSLLLSKKCNGNKVVPTRITTPRIWSRSDCLPTSSISVARPMLVLTVVRLAIGSKTVQSQSLDSLRVL
jgi:hypothetical protein